MVVMEAIAMMDWYGGWGWGGWLAMSLVMLVFWGLLAAGVVALVRTLRRQDREGPAQQVGVPGGQGGREVLGGALARRGDQPGRDEHRPKLVAGRIGPPGHPD